MSSVRLQNVRKTFGDVAAVDGVSLDVEEGEFVVLVGPSGCGKSTLLRLIAGLEKATEGVIQIGDRIVNDMEPKQRDVAMVFQDYALYPHMTVAENIGFGLRLRRVPRKEREERVRRAAEGLGLTNLLDRKPGELSGGQRQRAAMGRALVREPAVFLLDEPLSNLDAQLRVEMRAELLRFRQRLRVTTIYVTHDQTEAMTLGDKVAILRDGRLLQEGPPQALYERPSSAFVARFIGSPPMNLVRCGWESGALVAGDWKVAIDEPELRRRLASGAGAMPFALGVRPADLDIRRAREEWTDGVAPLRTRVEIVEQLGARSVVFFRSPGETPSGTANGGSAIGGLGSASAGSDLFAAEVEADLGISVGDEINVGLRDRRIHVFDWESGTAVWPEAAGRPTGTAEREGGGILKRHARPTA